MYYLFEKSKSVMYAMTFDELNKIAKYDEKMGMIPFQIPPDLASGENIKMKKIFLS